MTMGESLGRQALRAKTLERISMAPDVVEYRKHLGGPSGTGDHPSGTPQSVHAPHSHLGPGAVLQDANDLVHDIVSWNPNNWRTTIQRLMAEKGGVPTTPTEHALVTIMARIEAGGKPYSTGFRQGPHYLWRGDGIRTIEDIFGGVPEVGDIGQVHLLEFSSSPAVAAAFHGGYMFQIDGAPVMSRSDFGVSDGWDDGTFGEDGHFARGAFKVTAVEPMDAVGADPQTGEDVYLGPVKLIRMKWIGWGDPVWKHYGPGRHPGTHTSQAEAHGGDRDAAPDDARSAAPSGGGETAGTQPSYEELARRAAVTADQEGLLALNEYFKSVENGSPDLVFNRQQEIIDEASRLFNESLSVEMEITSSIQGAATEFGGQLVGLEHRVKYETSLRSKIYRYMQEGRTVGEAAGKVKDSIRYTVTFGPERWADGAEAVESSLTALGYRRVKADNLFGGHGQPGNYYDGYNTAWVAPSGTMFEVQIHTPGSLDMKFRTHPLYSQLRDLNVDDPERPRLTEQLWRMVNEAGTSHYPRNYRRIGSPIDESRARVVKVAGYPINLKEARQ